MKVLFSGNTALHRRIWRQLLRIFRGTRWGVMSGMPEYAGYTIGKWTYGGAQIYDWHDGTRLIIGNFCSIHPTTSILLGGEHNPSYVTTHPIDVWLPRVDGVKKPPVYPTSKGDIVIGHDVFVGVGSSILSGVKIGNGVVVAAGSSIARDVPPYAIVAGNPARVVRYRFPPEIIERLQRLAWWDWPDDKIRDAQDLLLSADIEKFLASHETPG